MTTSDLLSKLRSVTADGIVFTQMVRQFHWMTSGTDFFVLHEEYQTLYDYWVKAVDDLAERIVILGGTPPRTLAEALSMATLTEEVISDPMGMVLEVINSLTHFSSVISDASRTAQDEDDPITANMLDDIQRDQEKTRWKFRAYARKTVALTLNHISNNLTAM